MLPTDKLAESLRGKRVLVTGGAGGIGTAVCEGFANCGARIGIHYNRAGQRACELAKRIVAAGGEAETFGGDLLVPETGNALVESFIERFGDVDVLVNSAGAAFAYCNFLELDPQDWDQAFALNARAPFLVSRAAFLCMKRNHWGRIINISSGAVKFVGAKSLHYAAAKSALETLTIGMAREGAGCNVLVNALRCGVIDTAMRSNVPGYDEAAFKARVELVPLGRAGTPDDIAAMALFLASECGNFITGEIIALDGGE